MSMQNDPNFLDFEQPIADLQAKITELKSVESDNALNLGDEIERLEEKLVAQTEQIFESLSSWQIAQIARHPLRSYTLDYVASMMTDWHELHGDRHFSDDPAIVAGLGRIDGRPVMLIGHQKGRDTKSKVHRNFGMPRPEGYRKALRLMKLANRFEIPIITMIDTPGAYPGIGAEERNQSEAIARNLLEMSRIRVPIVCCVIGEGGSGGALAIGVGDCTLMLEYGTYSVISPEGCASILWKDAKYAEDAASALGITSRTLKRHELIDEVVPEPIGGSHRNPSEMASTLKSRILAALDKLSQFSPEALIERRHERIANYGAFKEA